MNRINTRKLLNSKWTAVVPNNNEKHFLIAEVEFDENGKVVLCRLEAVMSKRSIPFNWNDLQDDTKWVHGWE